MRLPRHDITLSLPAEAPAAALAADEALLDARGVRLWTASSPAVVVGPGLHHRLSSILDLERCQRAGVQVLQRRAGGGALLLDEHMLCGAIAVPIAQVDRDVTESYRWLAELLLTALDVPTARRLEVSEARHDVAALRASHNPISNWLLTSCYGALSPHEIVVGARKLVGLAQVRRRDAALFQFGILLRDQAPLADYLRVDGEGVRQELRRQLQQRTIGLTAVTDRRASAVAAAIADAMPSAR
jgi:lipoate---protein ligase